MNKNSIITFICFLFILLILPQLWLTLPFNSPENKHSSTKVSKPSTDSSTVLPVPKKSNTFSIEKKNHQTSSEDSTSENFTQAWNKIDITENIQVPKPSTNTEMLAIRLEEPNLLRHAHEGDKLTFSLPDHPSVTVEIDEVTYPTSEITQWTGKLGEEYGFYPVNMTMDEHTTIGRIVTPQGSYSIRLKNGKGWVYRGVKPRLHNDGVPVFYEKK